MKLLKSAAVRATALLLFFAMIAAVVLYQAGVYDIVFIQRPVVTVPEDSDTEADTTEPDDTTTESDTSEPQDTSASEPVEEVVFMDETLAENNANAKPLPEGVVEINGKYYKVTQKLMWGYRNAVGETVIEPQFASAYAFSKEGLAAVTDFDGSVFYINTIFYDCCTN